MKSKLSSTVIALSLGLFAAFAFTSCKSTSGTPARGMHNMGGPKPAYPMADENMRPR